MARFSSDGLDDLINDLKMTGELSGEMADKMLLAGAEEVKLAWRKAARMHGLILTEQMYNSIGYSRKPKYVSDMKMIDIYPQGMSTYTMDAKTGKKYARQDQIRNAEIAFILNYGGSNQRLHPATHWVDTADDLSAEPVEKAMREVYEEYMKGRHL